MKDLYNELSDYLGLPGYSEEGLERQVRSSLRGHALRVKKAGDMIHHALRVKKANSGILRHALRVRKSPGYSLSSHALRVKKPDVLGGHALRIKKDPNNMMFSHVLRAKKDNGLNAENTDPFIKREIFRSHILRTI